ncbi:WD-40 repeat protein [Rippkaea orientalis PCC 8801]|uniref:WD-40 repeat protein n=1 Tax=Rippkaea orientalis (strain PCC 8801 / RF-1) TaxID=41431 RepID=B7JVT4_RIPO1|nr:WD40 repeat domain-containing protein [Rippkaea orientalis]ACK64655.1 WD-40 repeat protein [Rippkaea orientalis PCC 8801]
MFSLPLIPQLTPIKQRLLKEKPVVYSSAIETSPYKGLMPYCEADAPYFFGRKKWTRIITDNLMSSRLTVVYGTSGVGKSSLLRAGVAYQFKQWIQKNLREFGYPEFAVIVFNAWRDDPVAALLQKVEETITQIIPKVQVPDPNNSLTDTLENWANVLISEEQRSGKLFIILDQFEEYFLYHGYEKGEKTFADQFSQAVNQTGLPVNFIIAIRENALAKLDFFKGSIPHLFTNYLRIPYLDEQAAVDAIRQPIRVFNQHRKLDQHKASHLRTLTLLKGSKTLGLALLWVMMLQERFSQAAIAIETELVQTIIEQVTVGQVYLGNTGRGMIDPKTVTSTQKVIETPYLQLVMTRLWEEDILKRGGNRLQLSTLMELGGAENIVKQHLSERMSRLSRKERNIAAQVFQYLVTPGGTKIAYPILQLAKDIEVTSEELQTLLDKLCQPQQYILRSVGPSPNEPDVERYEIFHDTLAPAILDWRQKYQQRQERNKWRKRTVAASAIALMMTGLFGIAEYQRLQAKVSEIKAIIAHADSLIIANRAFDALVEDLSAYKKFKQTEQDLSIKLLQVIVPRVSAKKQQLKQDIQRLLELGLVSINERNRLIVSEQKVLDVTFSHDGKWLATTSKDGQIKLWDLQGKLIQSLSEDNSEKSYFWRTSFSPDDQLLAAASTSGKINLWSLKDNQIKKLKSLVGHQGWIFDVKFHPTQPILASVSSDGTIKLWRFNGEEFQDKPIESVDVSEINQKNRTNEKPVIRTLRFSPDGKILATATDNGKTSNDPGIITLWIFKDNKLKLLTAFPEKHNDWIWDINFSHDGKMLATASRDGTVKLWNLEGQELKSMGEHNVPFTGVNFAIYGQKKEIIVIGASHDKTIKFWNLEGKELTTLKGHQSAIWRAIFSSDGKTLASASEDGTVKLWTLNDQDILGHKGRISQVSFNPDGQTLATAAEDHTVKLWRFDGKNTDNLQYLKTIQAHTNEVRSVDFSPDGSLLATASFDKTAKLWNWNLETDKPLSTFNKHTAELWKVEFNPKLSILGTVSNDGTAKLWKFDGTMHRNFNNFLQEDPDKVISLSFSPDGQKLATARWVRVNSKKIDVMLWDVNGLEKPIQKFPSLQTNWLKDIDFSADGSMIATSSKDGTVKLWSLNGEDQTPYQNNYPKINHNNSTISSVSFSPIQPLLLTASDDQTVKLWTIDGKLQQTFFGHQGAVLSATFSPNGQFIASSGSDGKVILWKRDLTLEELLQKTCNWLGGYLENNPDVEPQNKSLCQDQ